MPTFLYSAVDRSGASITNRIDAASLGAARYKLELQGHSKIVFHTDEMAAQFDQALSEEPASVPPQDVLSPEQELQARRGGGVIREIISAWKLNSIFWVPLFLWDGLNFYRGRLFTLPGYIGLGLTLLFVAYFVWLVLPGVAYQQLLESGVWHRWTEVQRWVRFIRVYKRLAFVPIPELELDFRLAYGIAAQGRLEQALASVKKYEDHKCGKYMYFSRLSGLYEAAGQYSKMTECRKTAARHGTGNAAEKIDIALGLVRREHNPAEARAILAEFDEDSCGDLAQMFVRYCQGLIAVEESDWTQAEERLRSVIQLASPYANNALVKGMLSEINAYYAIALARLGQTDRAQALVRQSEPLLKARKEHVLLAQCQAALAGAAQTQSRQS